MSAPRKPKIEAFDPTPEQQALLDGLIYQSVAGTDHDPIAAAELLFSAGALILMREWGPLEAARGMQTLLDGMHEALQEAGFGPDPEGTAE